MSGTWKFALAAARVYRSSLIGSFVIVVLASGLLAATGVLVESGARGDAPMLTALAASFAGTTLLVVLLVVGSTFAAGLRQRSRQFALLRAIGATGAQVRRMITAEVVLLFAVGLPIGAIPGVFAARTSIPLLESGGVVPEGFALTLSPFPVLAAVALLGPTALLAARVAAREAVRTDPTAAVRASAVEKSELSPVRRVAAWCTAGLGLGVAVVPFVMPGTFGAATGSSSALLLITAAALAGPALVGWGARRVASLAPSWGGAPGALAVLNARGHSRRLTAAVVPLALLLALGTVQSSLDTTLVRAAQHQLTEGISADVIVRAEAGLAGQQLAQVEAIDGVAAVVGTSMLPVEAKVESESEPFSSGELAWEPAGLLVVPDSIGDVLDPDVTAGSLDELSRPGTVAVSSDAMLGTFQGVGNSVTVRHADGTEQDLEIVAVFARGLGFGPFLVGEAALARASVPAANDGRGEPAQSSDGPEEPALSGGGVAGPGTVYVRSEDGRSTVVLSALTELGLDAVTKYSHVAELAQSGASQQRLSQALLAVLLGFLLVACVNTLAMLTGQRRRELALLHRTGTTRRQLLAMGGIESALVAGGALVIGSLAVAPALVGASFGMLGNPIPNVDWPVFGALAGVVVVVTLATIVAAVSRVSRPTPAG